MAEAFEFVGRLRVHLHCRLMIVCCCFAVQLINAGLLKKELINGKLLVVVAFTEQALSLFVLLLPAVATATPVAVAVPGVTGLFRGGDAKLAFVSLIFHKDIMFYFL